MCTTHVNLPLQDEYEIYPCDKNGQRAPSPVRVAGRIKGRVDEIKHGDVEGPMKV